MNRETEIKEQIVDVMRRNADRLRGHRMFLFGSRAAGDARPHSDFDVGIVGKSPLPLSDFYAIEDQLDDQPTLYNIDWMDFNRTSPRFSERAARRIEVLHGYPPWIVDDSSTALVQLVTPWPNLLSVM